MANFINKELTLFEDDFYTALEYLMNTVQTLGVSFNDYKSLTDFLVQKKNRLEIYFIDLEDFDSPKQFIPIEYYFFKRRHINKRICRLQKIIEKRILDSKNKKL